MGNNPDPGGLAGSNHYCNGLSCTSSNCCIQKTCLIGGADGSSKNYGSSYTAANCASTHILKNSANLAVDCSSGNCDSSTCCVQRTCSNAGTDGDLTQQHSSSDQAVTNIGICNGSGRDIFKNFATDCSGSNCDCSTNPCTKEVCCT